MDKKLGLSILLGSTLMLTGCGKKMNQFAADYFTTNPNPLEVVGQNVPATVTGRIPAKFFQKNATVTVTPYLTYNNTEKAAAPMTFQGEKVRGNNQVISYENGGTVTIPVNYVYEPEMQRSELYLGFTVDQKGRQMAFPTQLQLPLTQQPWNPQPLTTSSSASSTKNTQLTSTSSSIRQTSARASLKATKCFASTATSRLLQVTNLVRSKRSTSSHTLHLTVHLTSTPVLPRIVKPTPQSISKSSSRRTM